MTATAVLRAAASDIGYRESGVNVTKYWATWKPAWQGQPWCAAAVTDWLKRGGDLRVFGEAIFYCPSIEALAKKVGRWYTSGPKVGDIVLYSFGSNEAIHVGLVEKVLAGGWIQTIEGNTSSGNAGSQNNGDGVYRRLRSTSWGIRGYYRPSYTPAPKPAPAPIAPPKATPVDLVVDGDFGPKTVRAVNRLTGAGDTSKWGAAQKKAFQRWLGVKDDGIIGALTIIALQKKVGAKVDAAWGKLTTMALQRYLNKR